MKSPASPQMLIDPRTRQIIVQDRLEILRQMQLVVNTLDVPMQEDKSTSPSLSR